MKILVADDDTTSRLIAEKVLRSLGHECQSVGDGEQAWNAYRSQNPDVVISDWTMPGLSGLELCRRIRAEAGSYTYFILVTSHDGLDRTLEGMSAGADDYLLKPLDSDDLQARLIAAGRVTSLHGELDVHRAELERLNVELTEIALRDPLTGLGNRIALDEDLEHLEARVLRYGHRYCLALLDVDHFKAYNDSYGHQAGDQALRLVAAELKKEARGGDAVYRYGGEEFLCILPEQSLATATIAIQRMRSGLEGLAIRRADSPGGILTLSAGLAILEPGHGKGVGEVLKEADDALYRAKHLGRNRVESARLKAA